MQKIVINNSAIFASRRVANNIYLFNNELIRLT